MSDYKVKFEVFEGPLDLLLYLIKKDEVDIYDVNLTRLATDFIEYVEVMRLLDLEIAGEFLVMAATLMYIKSRELLPIDQQVHTEEDEEVEDPRWELIRQLVEYKKFKDAAARLQTLEQLQAHIYPRLPVKPEFDTDQALVNADVSLFDLIKAVNVLLKRVDQRESSTDQRDIFEDQWTVSDKIDYVMRAISLDKPVKFSSLFHHATSRTEVVVTFLAVLELIRLKQIIALQTETFGEIEIGPNPVGNQALPPTSETAAAN